MSLNDKEMELHRQLLAAFDEYIRLNLRWEDKGYITDARRTRKALRQIMNVAYLRWQEILVSMHEIDGREEQVELKEAGLYFIQSLHAAKNRNSLSEEDDNTST